MTGNKIIKAVGYIRVSTDEQVSGFSLDAQEERIKAYAKSQDYVLVDTYKDDGYSAKDLNRPAIKKLLTDCSSGKFSILLLYKLDRLTRRLKDLTEILEYLDKHGVKIESITEPFETKTAPGRLMLNVLG
ncbi:MAG: recombinase family protein, partial [Candidatus Hodarchaeales archaeon]